VEACLHSAEQMDCPLPKPIASLRGIKVHAVVTGLIHTLALADDGSVYAWGRDDAASSGALGLDPSVRDAARTVSTPQRLPALLVAYGL
jgi:alpha-tubulin suppressor-like RCC1 family protein